MPGAPSGTEPCSALVQALVALELTVQDVCDEVPAMGGKLVRVRLERLAQELQWDAGETFTNTFLHAFPQVPLFKSGTPLFLVPCNLKALLLAPLLQQPGTCLAAVDPDHLRATPVYGRDMWRQGNGGTDGSGAETQKHGGRRVPTRVLRPPLGATQAAGDRQQQQRQQPQGSSSYETGRLATSLVDGAGRASSGHQQDEEGQEHRPKPAAVMTVPVKQEPHQPTGQGTAPPYAAQPTMRVTRGQLQSERPLPTPGKQALSRREGSKPSSSSDDDSQDSDFGTTKQQTKKKKAKSDSAKPPPGKTQGTRAVGKQLPPAATTKSLRAMAPAAVEGSKSKQAQQAAAGKSIIGAEGKGGSMRAEPELAELPKWAPGAWRVTRVTAPTQGPRPAAGVAELPGSKEGAARGGDASVAPHAVPVPCQPKRLPPQPAQDPLKVAMLRSWERLMASVPLEHELEAQQQAPAPLAMADGGDNGAAAHTQVAEAGAQRGNSKQGKGQPEDQQGKQQQQRPSGAALPSSGT